MKRVIAFCLLFAALLSVANTASADNGIFVAEPKIYDDYALEQMLIQTEQSLASLQLVKSDIVTAALGKLQGAQVSRTQLGITATQLPTPTIMETASATPSTVTTTPTVTPSAGTAPSPPELTLPSAFSPSAIDTLDEMLQLNLRLANLRLLLRGSLTDQVSLVGDELFPQSSFTLGFPITIATPSGGHYRDAIAEVIIEVAIDENCAPKGSRPGLKMVLPREKTYNTAQVMSRATSVGTGVVSGIFNLGGNWIRGQSKYFLVQDQDTLAFEERSASSDRIVFGWRFKPVLGQRKVQPGLRQVFAQLTFPIPPGAASLGAVKVTTRWRKYERKTGALGAVIEDTRRLNDPFKLQRLDMEPGSVLVELLDVGSGNVRVILKPSAKFFEGTTFRLGGSPTVLEDVKMPTDHVEFDVSPLHVIRRGLFMGVRGQRERFLLNNCADPGVVAALPVSSSEVISLDHVKRRLDNISQDCRAMPSIELAKRRIAGIFAARDADPDRSVAESLCGDKFSRFKIIAADAEALGKATSRVRVILDKLRDPPDSSDLPFLTILGGKVYGLQDTPYETYAPTHNLRGERIRDLGVIEFLVDNATLEKATSIEVSRLLWGSDYHDSWKIERATRLAVTKHTIVSENNGLLIALEGQGLDQAAITFPTGATIKERQPGHAMVFIPQAEMTKLKQLVLSAGTGSPVLLDISKSTPPPAQPVLDAPDPVRIGANVEVPITWKNEGEIKAVSHELQQQTIVKSTKDTVIIRLDDSLTARPGKVLLSVEFKDGNKLPLTLQIVDQHIAVAH